MGLRGASQVGAIDSESLLAATRVAGFRSQFHDHEGVVILFFPSRTKDEQLQLLLVR